MRDVAHQTSAAVRESVSPRPHSTPRSATRPTSVSLSVRKRCIDDAIGGFGCVRQRDRHVVDASRPRGFAMVSFDVDASRMPFTRFQRRARSRAGVVGNVDLGCDSSGSRSQCRSAWVPGTRSTLLTTRRRCRDEASRSAGYGMRVRSDSTSREASFRTVAHAGRPSFRIGRGPMIDRERHVRRARSLQATAP